MPLERLASIRLSATLSALANNQSAGEHRFNRRKKRQAINCHSQRHGITVDSLVDCASSNRTRQKKQRRSQVIHTHTPSTRALLRVLSLRAPGCVFSTSGGLGRRTEGWNCCYYCRCDFISFADKIEAQQMSIEPLVLIRRRTYGRLCAPGMEIFAPHAEYAEMLAMPCRAADELNRILFSVRPSTSWCRPETTDMPARYSPQNEFRFIVIVVRLKHGLRRCRAKRQWKTRSSRFNLGVCD